MEEEKRKAKELKREELKMIIQEIQEEVQAKVSGQVVAMVATFFGDMGLLLRHLLKGGKNSESYNEKTMEMTKALQVFQQFDLGDSEYDSDSDSEQSVSSDEDNTKGTERDKGKNRPNSNACQCGKAINQYQTGKDCILYEIRYMEWSGLVLV